MPFVIAEYVPEDYEEVWSLHQKTIQENDGFVKNLAFHSDFQNIPREYEAFFVLRDGEEIVGMVGVKRFDSRSFEIKRLQVRASYQGQGFGRMLMDYALNYARTQGVDQVCLDVSSPQLKAQNLYFKLGFEVTHTKERVLGSDNEVFYSTYMRKDLRGLR